MSVASPFDYAAQTRAFVISDVNARDLAPLAAAYREKLVLLDSAIADLKAYQDVVNQAATLHIPILNQNRFMYYIGYYDQMKR